MKATPDTLSHNPTGVLSTLRHVEMWTAIRNERHVALIICYSNGNCTTDGCSAKKEVSNQGNTTVPDTGTTTPPTQHTHSYTETSRTDSTCTIAGTVNKQCACGATTTESLPLKSHSYTETGRTEPTCTTNGAINKTCACGATTTETLPAKHSYVNGTCTACGAADPNSTTSPPVSSAPEIEL